MERGALAQAFQRHRIGAVVAVAEGFPDSETLRGSGWRQVHSPGGHPAGNLVLARAPQPWGGGGDPQGFALGAIEPWLDEGWSIREELVAMAWTGPPPELPEGPPPHIMRERAADFVGRVFLPDLPGRTRPLYVRALACARGMEHRAWVESGAIVAAISLTRGAGVLGLHNVAVATERRNLGLGSACVTWAQAMAGDRPVVLQCAENLVPWYERRGFREIARVPNLKLA